MKLQPHYSQSRYPVSLQRTVDAVFGPNETLRHLLRSPRTGGRQAWKEDRCHG